MSSFFLEKSADDVLFLFRPCYIIERNQTCTYKIDHLAALDDWPSWSVEGTTTVSYILLFRWQFFFCFFFLSLSFRSMTAVITHPFSMGMGPFLFGYARGRVVERWRIQWKVYRGDCIFFPTPIVNINVEKVSLLFRPPSASREFQINRIENPPKNKILMLFLLYIYLGRRRRIDAPADNLVGWLFFFLFFYYCYSDCYCWIRCR